MDDSFAEPTSRVMRAMNTTWPGTGRVAAVEVLIATPTIAKLIEEMRFGQVYGAISEGTTS